MAALLALALHTQLRAWRRPSLQLLLAVPTLAAPACAAWAGDAFPRWHSGLTALCLVLAALALAAEALAGERADGSAVVFLAAPLAPWRCLLGKWLGITSLTALAALAALAAALGFGAAPPGAALTSFFLAWLRSCLAASAALAAGARLGPAESAFVAVLLEAGGYLRGLRQRLDQAGAPPGPWRISWSVFPDASLYDAADFSPLATLADALPRCLIPLLLGALLLAGHAGRRGGRG